MNNSEQDFDEIANQLKTDCSHGYLEPKLADAVSQLLIEAKELTRQLRGSAEISNSLLDFQLYYKENLVKALSTKGCQIDALQKENARLRAELQKLKADNASYKRTQRILSQQNLETSIRHLNQQIDLKEAELDLLLQSSQRSEEEKKQSNPHYKALYHQFLTESSRRISDLEQRLRKDGPKNLRPNTNSQWKL